MNSIALQNGSIYLKSRQGQQEPYWYYRRRIGKKYVLRALKTHDPEEAKRRAGRYWDWMTNAELISNKNIRAPQKKLRTFKDVYGQYIAEVRDGAFDNRRTTVLSKECIYRVLFKHTEIGNMLIDQITVADIGLALNTIKRERGMSGARRNRYRSELRRFFNYAITLGVVEHNPVIKTTHLPENKQRKNFHLFTPEEIRKLFEAARQYPKGDTKLPLLALAYYTGMRISEILSLQLDSINLETGEMAYYSSKTRKEMYVFIADKLRDILREYIATLPEDSVWLFPADRSAGHLVYARSQWRRLIKDAGIKHIPDRAWHTFRHGFITRMLEMGVPPSVIAQFTGQTVAIIERVYNWIGENKDLLRGVMKKYEESDNT